MIADMVPLSWDLDHDIRRICIVLHFVFQYLLQMCSMNLNCRYNRFSLTFNGLANKKRRNTQAIEHVHATVKDENW